ncbi:unnamed protein product [Medioppia subpectinata]|uniref:RING-type domain-containing protein n=1 Tax=Medioppia subpectinata TaxID=1979941 RepID=A0A7R9KJP3_9ACAR|nr:unnamed protein product [Medioppia subpectinata]CAG2104519.1 unnamed protein product [Medioppia subpectinata]
MRGTISKLSGAERGDRALEAHACYFPLCPFIMEMDVGNIPIDLDPIKNGRDVCGSGGSPMDWEFVDPNYTTYEDRLASFNSHEELFRVNIRQLAEAGFHYLGPGDRVKCFTAMEESTRLMMVTTRGSNMLVFSHIVNNSLLSFPNWMRAPFVRHMLDSKIHSKTKILDVMNNKWSQDRKPFTSFAQLYDACFAKYGSSKLEPIKECSDETNNLMLCKICFENNLNTVLFPCCHQISCQYCAKELKTCPMCRYPVQTFLKTFF